ncbi:MAG: NHL repeat-containing protein [Chloroflexota bacterium]
MAVAVSAPYRYARCIGMLGVAGRGYRNPVDLAFDGDITYVLNRANWKSASEGISVRVVVSRLPDDAFIGEIGHPGDDPGGFLWPTSIATDRQGRIYVADEYLQNIQVFNADGGLLATWGQPGSAPGQIDRPSGIAIDSQDRMIVVDHLNHRVQAFTLDGEPLACWGSQGSGPGQFDLPWGVGLDSQDRIYVADWRNDRVQQFTPDGQYLATFGESGPPEARLRRPAGVGVGTDGTVYVADWGNDRVQVYGSDGEYQATLYGEATLSPWAVEHIEANPHVAAQREAADPGYHEQERRLWGPTAVKLDAAGRIYIADSCRHRIQVYERA